MNGVAGEDGDGLGQEIVHASALTVHARSFSGWCFKFVVSSVGGLQKKTKTAGFSPKRSLDRQHATGGYVENIQRHREKLQAEFLHHVLNVLLPGQSVCPNWALSVRFLPAWLWPPSLMGNKLIGAIFADGGKG